MRNFDGKLDLANLSGFGAVPAALAVAVETHWTGTFPSLSDTASVAALDESSSESASAATASLIPESTGSRLVDAAQSIFHPHADDVPGNDDGDNDDGDSDGDGDEGIVVGHAHLGRGFVFHSIDPARFNDGEHQTVDLPGSTGSAGIPLPMPQPQDSSFHINITWGSTVGSAPAGFVTAVNAVVSYLESIIHDPITINIQVDYGKVDGQNLSPGALGESITSFVTVSYADLRAALIADGSSADDMAALGCLPSSDPTGGTYIVSTAEAKALGLIGPDPELDGYVGFSSRGKFDYDRSDGIGGSLYDFYGTVAHEITEVMGRVLNVGDDFGGLNNPYTPLDLYHWTGTGTRTFVGETSGYFSVDNGATILNFFNSDPSGDFGDWADSAGNDSFNAFSSPGVINQVTQADITAVDIIGYDIGVSDLTFTGSSSDDNFTGNTGDDTFNLYQGGNDTASGGAGNDVFVLGGAFNAGDKLDGGADSDTLQLDGDYGGAHKVVLANDTLTNVETIGFAAGHHYALVLANGTVANGASLVLDGSALGAGDVLNVDGRKETSGSFTFLGGAGADVLTGGAGNDSFTGGAGDDRINVTAGGNDQADAGADNDTIIAGAALTAADAIDGGAGSDEVTLTGDYSAGLALGATTLLNVELITLARNHSYTVTLDNATVASGQSLTVDGSTLRAGDVLVLDAGAETDGSVILRGGGAADHLTGGALNDTLNGGNGGDTLDASRGGADTANGGDGDDLIVMGAAMTASDRVNGGAGHDTLSLDGDYAGGLSFGALALLNVEAISLAAGHSYNLVLSDKTVAAGASLSVDGSALDSGDSLSIDGSHELDGALVLTGGAGADSFAGGAGADSLTGNDGADSFNLTLGGNDAASGGNGDDTFTLGAQLGANDQINGGAGSDTVALNGDYSAGLQLRASTIANVELVTLHGHHSYNLTMNDGNVAAGQTLTIDATDLVATDNFVFAGAAESDGAFNVMGGAGADSLSGGSGADTLSGRGGNDSLSGRGGADLLTGGGGSDTFVYSKFTQSTGVNHDTITDFDAAADRFDLDVAVAAIDTRLTHGAMSSAAFDANLATAVGAGQLGAHHAVLFTADSGTLTGHTFLVVDVNGTAGYQAGQDYVFDITGAANLNTLATADFV